MPVTVMVALQDCCKHSSKIQYLYIHNYIVIILKFRLMERSGDKSIGILVKGLDFPPLQLLEFSASPTKLSGR